MTSAKIASHETSRRCDALLQAAETQSMPAISEPAKLWLASRCRARILSIPTSRSISSRDGGGPHTGAPLAGSSPAWPSAGVSRTAGAAARASTGDSSLASGDDMSGDGVDPGRSIRSSKKQAIRPANA